MIECGGEMGSMGMLGERLACLVFEFLFGGNVSLDCRLAIGSFGCLLSWEC
jgi:hypothetical protein